MHADNTAEPSPVDHPQANTTLRTYLPMDSSFGNTPPPSRTKDDFGIGIAPDLEGLEPLQLGQTLVVYHPFAGRHPEIVKTVELMQLQESNIPPSPESPVEPYAPFKTRADFEQAEIFVRHNCTDTMINDQLRLNQQVSEASEQGVYTMKNAHEMHKTLAQAGQYQDTSSVESSTPPWSHCNVYVVMQFRSVEISVPYSHGVKSED